MASPTTYRAIDLTQAQAVSCSGAAHEGELETSVQNAPGPLPCAILPHFRGEPPLVGPDAQNHRRGSGLDWPTEAQVPYRGDWRNGLSRIPLVAAWSRLSEDDWAMSTRLNAPFGWKPSAGAQLTAKPSELLAKTAATYLDMADAEATALVVPDHMSDGALQLLKDELVREARAVDRQRSNHADRHHLLWRSAALALAWCERFSPELTSAAGLESGQELGHVIVVSMGLDSFEASTCAIQVQEHKGTPWLVPVIDRTRPEEEVIFGPWGASILGSLLAGSPKDTTSDESFWYRLAGKTWDDERLSRVVPRDAFSGLELDGRSNALNQLIQMHSIFEDVLPECEPRDERAHLGVQFAQHVRQARRHLSPAAQRTVLGVVMDGSLTQIRTGADRKLSDIYLDQLAQKCGLKGRRLVGQGELSADGAARFAWCAATGRPTYRERLRLLSFFAAGKNQLGDPKAVWTPLTDVDTVEGGRTWTRSEPIRGGLQIGAGSTELMLLLSNQQRDSSVVRSVPARLREPTLRSEPVELHVSVRPGQGYARVEVRSIRDPDMFRCLLDWREMKAAETPNFLMAYIPEVWEIKAHRDYRIDMMGRAEAVLQALETDAPDKEILSRLKDWRSKHLNNPQKPDFPEKEPWTRYGPIGTGGSSDHAPTDAMLKRIGNLLYERSRRTSENSLFKEIIRTTAWMYPAMPTELQRRVWKHLQAVTKNPDLATSDGYLTAAGHAFVTSSQMGIVFTAAATALKAHASPNNWLRAIRNLVKFRQHALNKDAVDESTMNALTGHIVRALAAEIENFNFERKFDNCLQIFMFLLKRRRYDSSYPNSDLTEKLGDCLTKVIRQRKGNNRPKPHQIEWAEVTLHFLERKATDADRAKFIQLESKS
jgi:hypothetical protein